MALESVLTNLDGLDDSLKAHYTEVDNVGFVLQTNNFVNDSVSYGNVDTKGLKSALDKEKLGRKEAEKGAQGLQSYSALGTPEEITAKLEAAANVGVDTDARLETLRAEYEGKITQANTVAAEALDGMKKANHSRELTALLNTHKSDIRDSEGAQNYFSNVLASMTSVDDAGNVIVVNADGTPRQTLAIDSVSNMSLNEAWGLIKSDPAHAFAIAPSGASGSGSSGSSGGGGLSSTPTDGTSWNSMSPADQRAYYMANPAKAAELAKLGAKA